MMIAFRLVWVIEKFSIVELDDFAHKNSSNWFTNERFSDINRIIETELLWSIVLKAFLVLFVAMYISHQHWLAIDFKQTWWKLFK